MISVCIATYNGEKYIYDQIHSILSQLSEVDEVIVSDDGSTDNTLEIIRNINDSRIKIYSHNKVVNPYFSNKTMYATSNFENALSKCTGDIIFLSDQDDVWYGNKVETCMKMIENCDFVMSNYTLVNDDMSIVKEKMYDTPPFSKNLIKVVLDPHMPGCCFCFRRSILKYALPFPSRILCHDLWIGLIAIRHFRTCYYDNPLIFHRMAPTSGLGHTSDNTFLEKIKYRLYSLLELQHIKRVHKEHK